MRTLKYRVWNPNENQFEPDAWLYQNGKLDHDTVYLAHMQNWIVSASTGIFDVDGKEIYEGDIVSFDNMRYSSILMTSPKIVEYDKGAFNIAHRLIENLKIVGNIYQNPNLVK